MVEKLDHPQQSASARKRHLKAKLAAQPPDGTRSAFREEEKKYLSRNPPPDYRSVIDLSSTDTHPELVAHSLNQESPKDARNFAPSAAHSDLGLSSQEKVYTLVNHPGLLLIPDAIDHVTQRRLIRNCLRNATRRPNLNNLDTHYHLPEEGLWHHFESVRTRRCADVIVRPILHGASTLHITTKHSRSLITDPAITADTSIDVLSAVKPLPVPSTTVKPESASDLLYKLRWTNLGLMYHWDTKSYRFQEVFQNGMDSIIPVPSDLAHLSKLLLDAIPQHLVPHHQDWSSFKPESGIINFYQLKNALMGHVDQSELVEDQPLVSFSFGHSAVFLIGGTTRDERPTALYLRSGDALIMSGSCRRVYHGVPRVVEGTLPSYLSDPQDWDEMEQANASKEDLKDWRIFAEYLSTTRINVNIRQVFPEGYLEQLPSDAACS